MRQRHRDVNELAATGLSLSAIGRRLQLDRKTVRRYRHSGLDDVLASARDRGAGVLDPSADYVQHRFGAGCTSSMQLCRELLAPPSTQPARRQTECAYAPDYRPDHGRSAHYNTSPGAVC